MAAKAAKAAKASSVGGIAMKKSQNFPAKFFSPNFFCQIFFRLHSESADARDDVVSRRRKDGDDRREIRCRRYKTFQVAIYEFS